MFKKILIANRGEIACRIIKTARELGIRTVAIYSVVDEGAKHVALADEAYCIGEAASKQSYLNSDAIIAAALKSKAEAIHPGYGFLAENPRFAEACLENNIIFIGPNPNTIALMGDKIAAKRVMAQANVPLIPGYDGDTDNLAVLKQQAEEIGYPLLIKAAAGGGGKGIRLVETHQELETALTSAKREAQSSFGNNQVFLEKYFPQARHIELQIFADQYGNVVHLFDRDCSIQRRHQKIIEEAPAPFLSASLKQQMADAAIRAVQAISYLGAGTLEFLVADQQFYFMEMNTRLQVEHAVTEMITGIDLVAWQLSVAAGEKLPLTQSQISFRGHAIEARLYAEDPSQHYLPSSGMVVELQLPVSSPTLRVDSGIRAGDVISVHYDSLLAKIIVHADNRMLAIQKLQTALIDCYILGVTTNSGLLHAVLAQDDFRTGKIDTLFIDEHSSELIHPLQQPAPCVIVAASLAYFSLLKSDISPWHFYDGWRMGAKPSAVIQLWFNEKPIKLNIEKLNGIYRVIFEQEQFVAYLTAQINHHYTFLINQQSIAVQIFIMDEKLHCFYHANHYVFHLLNGNDKQDEKMAAHAPLTSPMPGTITDVLVSAEQVVQKGEKLIVIEAMKMEHALLAPCDGVVKSIFFQTGDAVQAGVELLDFISDAKTV